MPDASSPSARPRLKETRAARLRHAVFAAAHAIAAEAQRGARRAAASTLHHLIVLVVATDAPLISREVWATLQE